MGGVDADTEGKTIGLGGLGPARDQVFPGAKRGGVPWLVFAVPVVKIVMVVGHGKEILRAGPLIERHQLVRVPVLGFPGVDDILEPVR